jgi:hypothetical protein
MRCARQNAATPSTPCASAAAIRTSIAVTFQAMGNSPQQVRCQRCPETSIRQRSPETRHEALRQPEAIQSAFAMITTSEVRIISALTGEVDRLGEVVAEHLADTGTLTSTPASPDSA